MIKGKGLNELKNYRLEVISRGIAAGEILDETFFGHHLFCIKDPDGNGIRFILATQFSDQKALPWLTVLFRTGQGKPREDVTDSDSESEPVCGSA